MEGPSPVFELRGITKRFPGVLACDRVDLQVYSGEIHVLFGENGAGKSTLMKILYGQYQPDAGEIWIDGMRTVMRSPRAAIRAGIGMVFQDFALIPSLAVAENIVLAAPGARVFMRRKSLLAHIQRLAQHYELPVEPSSGDWLHWRGDPRVSWPLTWEKRLEPPAWLQCVLPVLAAVIGLLLGAILLSVLGVHPWYAYQAMAEGAFGSFYSLSETLVKATPLLLAGLGVGLAFRLGFWNIGAEGQLYMGAMGATWVALTYPELPGPLLQPLMVVAGCLAGAVWGLIPTGLRVYRRVNEISTTLMLNYIAILWVDFLVYDPWKDPRAFGFPFTPPFSPAALLPSLPGSRVHLGLLLGLLAAAAQAVVPSRTRLGYEIRIIGLSPEAARYAGMNLARVTFLVMALSGGLAGLAGACEVAGVQGQLKHGLSPGYGYTAVIVAWLARLNPWATIVASVFLGGLLVGSDLLQIAMNLPVVVAYVLQGLVLFALLSVEFPVGHRVVWKRRSTG